MPQDLARVVSSSLEDLKRFKREHAAEQRAAAALHLHADDESAQDEALPPPPPPPPSERGSPEILSARGLEHAKELAEAWANSAMKAIRQVKQARTYLPVTHHATAGAYGRGEAAIKGTGGTQSQYSDPDSSDSSDDSSKNSQGDTRITTTPAHNVPKETHSQLMGRQHDVLWPPGGSTPTSTPASAVEADHEGAGPTNKPQLSDVSGTCLQNTVACAFSLCTLPSFAFSS